MKKKALILVLAAAIIVVASVGGTLAWLQATTKTVTNVFTVGDVGATLTETDAEAGIDGNFTKGYHVVPGQSYTKDPKAGVDEGSEDAYLFVKIAKSVNFDAAILKYTMADGWSGLEGHPGVYYRTVLKNATPRVFSILQNDEITVDDDVTADQLAAVKDATLSFTVYAIQSAGADDAAEAWTNGGF